jgi:mannose-1-phosphate guanylyltransferase
MIKDALAFHRHHGGLATILCLPHPEVGGKFGGLWVQENQTQVQKFSKTPVANHRGLHFVGVMLLNDSIENYFFEDDSKEENILYDTLTKAMAAGEKAHAFEIKAQWFETGNPQDFLSATEACTQELSKPQTKRARWAENLGQIICRHSTNQYQIENTHPELEQRMIACLEKLKSGN